MSRPKRLILSVFWMLILLCPLPAPAADDRRGVDLFLGGGLSGDPNDDDNTGNVSFGAGYRGSRYWAAGVEGFRIKLSDSGTRILVGPYAKGYPFYNRFVNPYARAGVALVNLKTDSSEFAPDSRFNLVGSLAAGLEAGFSAVALYGEVSHHAGVRRGHSSTYDSLGSITIGLSLHIFGSGSDGTDRKPGRIR